MDMFITFEGIDASGKTTQLELLETELKKSGFNVLVTRQPGGTQIGQLIRQILLNPENTQLVPEAEVLLYMADRIQHIKEVILPALAKNRIVLCDRYHDATLAYQGGGRQLDLSWLEQLQEKHIIAPDLTLWFDISVEQSQDRLKQRNQSLDVENCRLESENSLFFNRVRSEYARLCQKKGDRFIQIEASEDISSIQRHVLKIVLDRLN
ncbi:MAG: dTMP kinase [Deltaproteobacteria bacterium]|nr:dTMP kinase [Deltaproteobacteria bacterium]MBT4088766.1 dTMP kinase [Deltaproteobacteria bacterium]MBT4263939.1 dTMP kinase [Deltaproteobacteria bacterium]MBT4639882.1 dTMP kinase [Deltaproteobacteria bacterium]MBT6611100.1 dTMP kinase [Deltaproteobacteria bacterium]